MPIVGWNCPVCKRKVPLTHYQDTVCGMSIHPDYADAVLHGDDDYYGTDLVTVTNGLGCPRAKAIEVDADIHVNPVEYNAMLIGKAWDKHMEKFASPMNAKIEVRGTLAGIQVAGEIDRIRECTDGTNTFLVIEDHKHGNNFAQRFAKKEGVKLEHKLQLSMYGYLYSKMYKVQPTHGAIWNHYSGAPAGKAIDGYIMPFVFLLMDITTCLNTKPHNGQYTVAELLQQTAQRVEGDVRWEDLPLVGQTMSFGQVSYCDYCQVRDTCFTQAKGAPF